MQDLNLTLIQTELYWEEPAANRAMLEEKIWTETGNTDLIILPEMFTTGFSMNAKALAEVHRTNTHKWMQQMAREKNAVLMGSYITKDNGKIYNRLHVVFPDGNASYYDKRHLFTLAGEHQEYTPGNDRLIVEWKGWKICPMVCYDLRFPTWARNTYNKTTNEYAYDLLVYVANWPTPRTQAWDTLLQARAIENQCFVAGVNRTGTDENNLPYSGHSAVYDFTGKTLSFGGEAAGIFDQIIEKEPLDSFRQKYAFLHDADQYERNT